MEDEIKQLNALIAEIERKAYQRGWAAAVKHILNAAQSKVTPVFAMAVQKPPLANKQKDDGATIIELVEETIKVRPGLAGHEIVARVVESMPGKDPKSLDRSARTALARLKSRHKIMQRGKNWWPVEKSNNEKTEEMQKLLS